MTNACPSTTHVGTCAGGATAFSNTARVAQQPDAAAAWPRLALVHLHTGQTDAFTASCRAMQQRFRAAGAFGQALLTFGSAPHDAVSIALTVRLLRSPALPAGAGDYDRQRTVRTAVLRADKLTDPATWLPLLPPGEKLLRGTLLCRAGQHAAAVQELATEKTRLACLFRALAGLGRGDSFGDRKAPQARPRLPV